MIYTQKILIIDDTREVSDMFLRKFANDTNVKLAKMIKGSVII